MSVWKAACYRDDALQRVCSLVSPDAYNCPFIHSLCDFDIEDAGTFDLPPGVTAGNLRRQVERNVSVLNGIIDKTGRRDPNNEVFETLVVNLGETRFGVHGVYHFVSENWNQIFRPDVFDKQEATFFDHIYQFGFATSYRTGREGVAKSASAQRSIAKYILGPNQAIRDLIKLGTKAAGPVHRRDVSNARIFNEGFPKIEDGVPSWLRKYDIYWWKGILILQNYYTKDCYTFTRDDINRIERLVLGFAWSGFYISEYAEENTNLNARLVAAFDRIMGLVKEATGRVSKRDANKLCRAFDVALWYYIARKSNDINDTAIKEQQAKIRKEGLDKLVDQERIMAVVESFKMREALELLQIYKAFPQPDFDYFGAAKRQMDLYSNVREYGPAVEDEDTGTYEDLFLYFRFTLIRSFHKKHGMCPGVIRADADDRAWHHSYPYISPDKIPYKHVKDIDMNNTFSYIAHGTDILDLVKDKAICPKSAKDLHKASDYMKVEISEKNQLMDVLGRKDPVDMQKIVGELANIYDDVKAEDKPEAKKPFGRWFFEAFTDRRLVQSEYEGSVAEYAKTTVGCMAGKSTRDKVAAMNYITELPPVGSELFTIPLLISFDLEKFSPSLGMEYHERADVIFADVFGKPHLAHASDVFKKGDVHYVKRNIHHTFPKQGRDYEGFSGRKNTIYHCGVMGYCVRRLRDLNLIPSGGRFVSLIDDGLLRVEVSSEGYHDKVRKILEVIEKIYKMANLYISWDKTFVSSKLAVFLNEFYFQGTPVTPGIRAFLKLTNRSDSFCPSILDDLAMLDSTARGAITAGAPGHVTYAGYAYYVMDAMRKWSRGKTKLSGALALAGFAPVGLGGFGLSSINNLSGSVAGPSFVEGIGNLRAIAVRFRTLAPNINKIVNTEMRPLPADERIRAPMAVRRAGRTLKATRGRLVIERRLKNMIDTPVIRSLIGELSVRSSDDAAEILSFGARVPIEALTSTHNSTIQAVLSNISAKFLRARTATKLVPLRAFFRAHAANVTEATALIHEWDM